MPQTKKGKKIENAIEKEYGAQKGKAVYFVAQGLSLRNKLEKFNIESVSFVELNMTILSF